MAENEIRVRLAPSPTGDPHVGTAYQAVFNHAFAKGRGGKLILRIEDTDRERSTPESEGAILESLRWLGIPWEEGPDVGGPHGPYRQSERTGIYREQTGLLLEERHAYRCFCTRERLEEIRARSKGAVTGYDRHCRDIDPGESDRRAAAGETFVVRMKVPLEGECVMSDLLRGEIRRDWASVDDQIVLKSDGLPTYHLANVVDDHLMEVSHVIRGEEWINSLPKHVKLYEYLGWKPPVFCHLPLLRNPDKSKLSKRKNPTSISYYRRAGFVPEALRNYLGLMGWTMPGGEEKFTLDQMCENLKIEEISLGGPVFDVEKLRWLNGRYIREDYTDDALLGALEGWSLGRGNLTRIVPLVHQRLETLSDWGRLTAPFFTDEIALDPAGITIKNKQPEEVLEILQLGLWRLEELRDFSASSIKGLFEELSGTFEIKLRDLCLPFYVSLAGSAVWTPLFESMEILGADLVRVRLRRAIAALGGVSSKKAKAIEKRYADLFGRRRA
jgi:glutamyl-tRNA synthetase